MNMRAERAIAADRAAVPGFPMVDFAGPDRRLNCGVRYHGGSEVSEVVQVSVR
jgi:hypothetical protein